MFICTGYIKYFFRFFIVKSSSYLLQMSMKRTPFGELNNHRRVEHAEGFLSSLSASIQSSNGQLIM